MLSVIEHIDNLVRHINLVQEACIIIGKKLINRGDIDEGKLLIFLGYQHDVSKFLGIEFDYLHNGASEDKEKLDTAIKHHARTNTHHIEFWSNKIENMPPIYIREMVADWHARSTAFGTDLRKWIEEKALVKYKIDKNSSQYKVIQETVDLLLEEPFA